jgi:1-acyl-sn-glycerol-3-phosphate acyltransferase
MKSFFSSVKYWISILFFKLKGWSCDLLPKEAGNKFVLIGFPHNTNMDAPFGIAFSFYNKVVTNPMLKAEWFFWPMTILFNAIGAVKIDRSSSNNVVDQITAEFAARDHFIPVIFPEGTRSKVKSIKTGFWNIATQANVPVVLLYKCEEKKKLMILGCMKLSHSIKEDLLAIQAAYRKEGYEIPMDTVLEGLK